MINIIISSLLSFWMFGNLQRLYTLKKYTKDIKNADYLNIGLNVSTLFLPAIIFYFLEKLNLFLLGFVFGWSILIISTLLVMILLAADINKNVTNSTSMPTFGIVFNLPITVVMIATGLYLGDPFTIGASMAVLSSWIGYIATR